MTKIEKIYNIIKPTLESFVRLAESSLPENKKRAPWIGLDHGVKILHTDEELDQYLCAYGLMHKEKIYSALRSYANPQEIFNSKMTIIDWGCGQALATVCFLDFLKEVRIEVNIDKVIFIEPSIEAIERGTSYVYTYLKDYSIIEKVNKYIDDVTSNDIQSSSPLTVHFFSNILDIESINLKRLANLLSNNIKGRNLFFCVCPSNRNSNRIQDFASDLNIDKQDIVNQFQGSLPIRGTINMLVFEKNGANINVIKADYCPDVQININSMQILQRILSKVTPKPNIIDKVLQFYQLALDLERKKEPKVDATYTYPFKISGKDIILDLECVPEFNRVFNNNKNPYATKYPKNLYVAFTIEWNNLTYRVLRSNIPFELFKDIDTSKNNYPCAIKDFEVDIDVAEQLQLSDEQVGIINEAVKSDNVSLSNIEVVLKRQISDDVKLNKDAVEVGLCNDNMALIQTTKELEGLNSVNIASNDLLVNFLSYTGMQNKQDNVYKEELIEAVKMDEPQKEAVVHALNDRLSVVTGPPGCGKTQVILNIIANALIWGKSVLISSKNNKAVDNVKERFDTIDGIGFVMRFGSKTTIKERTISEMDRMVQIIQQTTNNDVEYSTIERKYNSLCSKIKSCKATLQKREKLNVEQFELSAYITKIQGEIEEENTRWQEERTKIIDSNRDKFNASKTDKDTIEDAISKLQVNLNTLEAKYSGLGKIFFRKKKYAAILLNLEEMLPAQLKQYVKLTRSHADVKSFRNGNDIIGQNKKDIDILREVSELKSSYEGKNRSHCVKINEKQAELDSARRKKDGNQIQINAINSKENAIKVTLEKCRIEITKLSERILKSSIRHHLSEDGAAKRVIPYKNYFPDNIPWRTSDFSTYCSNAKSFLHVFPLNAITSLSIKGAFPLENGLFDMLIIDEASQCDIASAIPLIMRSKQICVIGDPLQLKHITSVTTKEEQVIKNHLGLGENQYLQYKEKSLWDYCNELVSKMSDDNRPVILTGHYRCQPRIIGYSNDIFYARRLGTRLEVKTTNERPDITPKDIVWIDVHGSQRADNININEAEARVAVEKARELSSKYKDVSIGIVTPFKRQAEFINSLLYGDLRNTVVADTVHKFQGDEKDIMIYSLVVTDNSPLSKIHWIDWSVPNLVNVAVTRARQTLYVIGNKDYVKSHSNADLPLGYLADYAH